MRRGFEQPTASSVSRSTDAGTYERTRQGRNNVQAQADPISTRRNLPPQPYLTLPQQPDGHAPVSPGRKSPAYLEGKNPYGKILENAEHPYRKPKVLGGAPSQIGATSESRPRTSGSFHFKTRPVCEAEFKPEVTVPSPTPDPLPSPLPRQMPMKSISVQAVKNFFEDKSTHGRSGPLLPPLKSAAAVIDRKVQGLMVVNQPPSPLGERSMEESAQSRYTPSPIMSLDVQSNPDRDHSVSVLSSNRSSQVGHSHVVNPFAPPESGTKAPHVPVGKVATPHDGVSSSGQAERQFDRQSSTDSFENTPREPKSLNYAQEAVGESSRFGKPSNASLVNLEHTDKSDGCVNSKAKVRHHYTCDSLMTTESDQGTSATAPASHRQA